MKKHPFFFVFALIVLIFAIVTPNMMYSSLPKVNYIKANKQSAVKTITVSGKINAENEYNQFADEPIFIDEILVNEGEKVTKGDKLFKVTSQNKKYIASKFSGTINKILVKAGTFCEQNTPLINIIDTSNLYATLLIGENVFQKIKIGQKLNLTGNAFSGNYKATITKLGATATDNATSGTFVEAVAKLQNPDENLKPGFNVKAKIITKTLKDVILLPSNVISQDNQGEFVYKLNQNKAQKVYIKTDDITRKGTIIKNGVKADDYIISNPWEVQKDNSYISLKGD
ncbi:MAG: HlyD family efflux transporter periplasmic adaptor subunit [Clostridia bacterium]|nr:HlyD family efflux transporter periplasmic adaptor subunit [Clostridia bacterium]